MKFHCQSSKRILTATVAFAGLSFILTPARAFHYFGGLTETNGIPGLQAGDALAFVINAGVNGGQVQDGTAAGAQFLVLDFGVSLLGLPAGLYANPDGFNGGITWTALSNGRAWNTTTSVYRTPNPFAATSGSLLRFGIVGVTGPLGAKVSLWDTVENPAAPTDTWTVGTGLTAGDGFQNATDVGLIVGDGVNDGIGEPPAGSNATGVDPYGHIHDRTITADLPGIYTVSYILRDANGKHPDSAPISVTFNTTAVPEPSSIALLGGAAMLLGVRRRRPSCL